MRTTSLNDFTRRFNELRYMDALYNIIMKLVYLYIHTYADYNVVAVLIRVLFARCRRLALSQRVRKRLFRFIKNSAVSGDVAVGKSVVFGKSQNLPRYTPRVY